MTAPYTHVRGIRQMHYRSAAQLGRDRAIVNCQTCRPDVSRRTGAGGFSVLPLYLSVTCSCHPASADQGSTRERFNGAAWAGCRSPPDRNHAEPASDQCSVATRERAAHCRARNRLSPVALRRAFSHAGFISVFPRRHKRRGHAGLAADGQLCAFP